MTCRFPIGALLSQGIAPARCSLPVPTSLQSLPNARLPIEAPRRASIRFGRQPASRPFKYARAPRTDLHDGMMFREDCCCRTAQLAFIGAGK